MHLRENGIFAASVPNPILLESLPENQDPSLEEVFYHPVSGNPVQVSSSWTRTPEDITLNWIYDHLLPDGNVERHIASSRHVISSLDDYEADYESSGFQLEMIYGDFDGSPYSSKSPYLLLVARIPG
jgi:hypothetical protein